MLRLFHQEGNVLHMVVLVACDDVKGHVAKLLFDGIHIELELMHDYPLRALCGLNLRLFRFISFSERSEISTRNLGEVYNSNFLIYG